MRGSQRRHHSGLFLTVLLLSTAAAMGILVLSSSYLVLSEHSTREAAAAHAEDLAYSVEQTVSRALNNANLVLESLLDLSDNAVINTQGLSQRIRARLQWSPFLRDIIIVNGEGQILASSSRHNVVGMTVADISFFEKLKKSRAGFLQISAPSAGRDIRAALASGRDENDHPIAGKPWHFLLGRRLDNPEQQDIRYAIALANPSQLLRLIDRTSFQKGQTLTSENQDHFVRLYRYDGVPLVGNRVLDKQGTFEISSNDRFLFDHLLPQKEWGVQTHSFWEWITFERLFTFWSPDLFSEKHGLEPPRESCCFAVTSYRATVHWPILVSIELPQRTVFQSWYRQSVYLTLAMIGLLSVLTVLTLFVLHQMKQADKAAKILHLRTRSLAASSNGIIIADAQKENWPIVYVNPSFSNITGFAAEEVIGRHCQVLKRAVPDDPALKAIRVGLQNGTNIQVIFRNLRKDGTSFWNELKISPVHDEAGQLTHFIGVQNDVSEVINAKKALEETVAQLARSNAELEQFAYISSHDLQEPLRMVSSYLNLLQKRYGDILDEDGRDYMEFASKGARRMRELIMDLLEYSRLGRDIESELVDSGKALQESLDHLSILIADHKAHLSLPVEMPMVLAQPRAMVSVFQNILSNALKYASPHRPPQIILKWHQEDKFIHFEIIDNGIGIDEEHFDRIFKIFQRLHDREHYEGTGLGLSLCKKIIETHGGCIWLESRKNVGTIFHFTLLRAKNL